MKSANSFIGAADMMASDELSSNKERIIDALIANLHVIYFGDQIEGDAHDDVAKRAIAIAVDQAGEDAVYGVLRTTVHRRLKDKILPLIGTGSILDSIPTKIIPRSPEAA
jgi:hypothetical protein